MDSLSLSSLSHCGVEWLTCGFVEVVWLSGLMVDKVSHFSNQVHLLLL